MNCRQTGLSSPRRARSISRTSAETCPPSAAYRSSTMSPGTTRMSRKISTATPRSVGIMRSRRRMTYRCTGRPGRALLGEPDVPQVLAQVVAGRHVPAFHLRPVWDDTLPPDRRHLVGLFEHEPLELAHQAAPLVVVRGPALLEVQVV